MEFSASLNLPATTNVAVFQIIEAHVAASTVTFLAKTQDSIEFLRSMDKTWKIHCQQLTMIRAIYLFLDRTYALQNLTVPSLWDAGLEIFRKHYMITHVDVRQRTVDGILMLIEQERKGEMVRDELFVAAEPLVIYMPKF